VARKEKRKENAFVTRGSSNFIDDKISHTDTEGEKKLEELF
jgi:hypothetical protein